MNDAPIIVWDTSVFLAWLQEETSAVLDAMDDRLVEAGVGQIRLAASVVLLAELLEAAVPTDQSLRFEAMIETEILSLFDVDRRVAATAGRIRSRGRNRMPKLSLKTADALHLACAIHAEAVEFQTLDRQLLNLSGSAIVDGLTIRRPG